MVTLEDTIVFATQLHNGQKDKAGAPYILHVLRVMLQMKTEQERIVALLHDVAEDCNITLEPMMGFGQEVMDAVDCLTKRPQEEHNYDAFIQRIASGPALARRVKIADLRDNSDLTRFAQPTEADRRRCLKYHRALAILTSLE
ncbi:MAG: HD domain-containing protein [Candidatus Komeilibacteria bacterium]